ncbi:MAG: putative membrane-bound dehydrogenase-like protein [Planctomycetaceae bacterium]|jgi:putative membrane-bound dehydrogenase-like protein
MKQFRMIADAGLPLVGLVMAMLFPLDAIALEWKTLDVSSASVSVPKSLDDAISIELVAADPDIVTPIACRFDSEGRLLVVESHTHFPKEEYGGLPHDRVRILRDSNDDGRLDQIATFHQGTHKTMGMAIGRDGWVYVSTRASVIRVRDFDGDDVADQTETLLTLKTDADYPHNGLSGLLLDESSGTLMVGMGENLGADYTLIGQDGTSHNGGGEGGNIFECSLDGGGLRLEATGFWNPFGLCRDSAGRVLMVGNDADATPPCRISEVVPMGDYGFQFRFGRSGKHPLQAWNGELPGTLPMVCGTGEAPCAILPFRGQYWVTSWGDNRIERYTAKPNGASIVADQDVVIAGGSKFRPVDMTVAPDGSLLVTDWVDRSYNVHSTGRIWRVRFKEKSTAETPPLSKAERAARNVSTLPTKDVIDRLATDDVFAWQWALEAAAAREDFTGRPMASFSDARIRLAWLMAHRWNHLISDAGTAAKREAILRAALADPSEPVRLAAVRWASERRVQSLQQEILQLLKWPKLSPRLLAAVVSSVSYLETGEVKRVRRNYFDELTAQRLVDVSLDSGYSDAIRIAAIRLVPPVMHQWTADTFRKLMKESSGDVQREAARHLAVAARGNDEFRKIANRLIDDQALSKAGIMDIRSILEPAKPLPVDRSLPESTDIDAWMKKVGTGGDAEAGWRVFFGATANCSACHQYNGRGKTIGPALTGVAGSMNRRRLLQSILEPSREMAPMYVPFSIVTVDGRVHQGMKIQGGGKTNTFLGADGKTFEIPLADIELQQPSNKSIMPDGLPRQLTTEQLRDLLAMLSQKTSKVLAGSTASARGK